MAANLGVLANPARSADYRARSPFKPMGIALGLIGVVVAVIALVANIVAAGDVGDGTTTRETLAWTFGLSTAAVATIKIGIGTILMGIVIRLWIQAESMKTALADLMPDAQPGERPRTAT